MKQRIRNNLRVLESLEARLAPASTVVLGDVDGDQVRFKSSVGDLTGRVTSAPAPGGLHSVYSVNLTGAEFTGTNFSVTVVKGPTGDGLAIVGHINAGTNNLGTVRIKGDLGNVDAGNGTSVAIKSLTVDSFGRFGQSGSGDYVSTVSGNVLSLVVKHDFNASYFRVAGDLHSVRIGGSIIGGLAADSGRIHATDDLGKVSITQNIVGGQGTYSGSIGAGHDVAKVALGGSIYGGNGNNSGNVYAAFTIPGEISKVRIGGSVVGGAGQRSGMVGGLNVSGGTFPVALGTVFVGKDILGGSGYASGAVMPYSSTLDRLTVKGSVIGGSADFSGLVEVYQHGGNIVIGGSVFGGNGSASGRIYVANGLDLLRIRGDLRGSSGSNSGTVYVGGAGITTKVIGGAIIPGTGGGSGTVVG